MAFIARLFVVAFAYLVACVAASAVLTVGTLTPQWDDVAALVSSLHLPSAALWVVIGVGAAIIAGIAMLPALLVIALAEGFGWRSVVLYGVLGGVLALALRYGIDFGRAIGGPETALAAPREVLAASGIAGGLVYWLFAGRRAGIWKS
jgi:hypothetical protein